MQKTKNVSGKDRVVCKSGFKGYKICYKPERAKEEMWLFDIYGHSISIYNYFAQNGVRTAEGEFSLTINQLYALKKYRRNYKINKILERLPAQIEYAIRENLAAKQEVRSHTEVSEVMHYQFSYDDFEYAV